MKRPSKSPRERETPKAMAAVRSAVDWLLRGGRPPGLPPPAAAAPSSSSAAGPSSLTYYSTGEIKLRMARQDDRLSRLRSEVEEKQELFHAMTADAASMLADLGAIRKHTGKLVSRANVAKASSAARDVAATFSRFDVDRSGGVDVAELRAGLSQIGLDSHSPQARAIVGRYSHHGDAIDVKRFATFVRDVQLLLTFDQDGNGNLDCDELRPALNQLGLPCDARQGELILRAWDVDQSGTLDLLEFTDLVRSLQAFSKFDTDGSGDIDVSELRGALQELGLGRTTTSQASAILARYDSGGASLRLDFNEFERLVNELRRFQAQRSTTSTTTR